MRRHFAKVEFSRSPMRNALGLSFVLCAASLLTGQTAPAGGNKPADESAAAGNQKLVVSEPNTLMSEEKIPMGARVYIAPMANGFDNYITAGLQQKKVPIVVVADRSKAEFEISGVAETDKAGWAKMLFMG